MSAISEQMVSLIEQRNQLRAEVERLKQQYNECERDQALQKLEEYRQQLTTAQAKRDTWKADAEALATAAHKCECGCDGHCPLEDVLAAHDALMEASK